MKLYAFSIVLALLILFSMAAVIAAMFISLGNQGDERRRMIVEKAGSHTLAVTAAYFLLCIIENIVKVFTRYDITPEGMNPFVTLTVIAVVYIAHLVYYKRKFGG